MVGNGHVVLAAFGGREPNGAMTSSLTKWSRMTAGPSPSSKWHRITDLLAELIVNHRVCLREDGHTQGFGCVSSLVGVLDNEYELF